MTIEELKVGDKVVPHTKSIWGSLSDSVMWKKAQRKGQKYLYVTEIKNNRRLTLSDLNNSFDRDYGDYFYPEDVTKYQETEMENLSNPVIIIQGPPHLRKAFIKDLNDLNIELKEGHTLSFLKDQYLIMNYESIRGNKFSEFNVPHPEYRDKIIFSLPQEYVAALEYIKKYLEKSQKTTSISITIGNPERTIRVERGQAIFDGREFSKTKLTELLDRFSSFVWCELTSNVTGIQIGCEQGTCVTREDVLTVLQKMRELS